MRNTYVEFEMPISQVPAHELRQKLGEASLALVTRSIIMSELKYPTDKAVRDLRDIWYASVKPVFDKLGLLEQPSGSTVSYQQFMKGRMDNLQEHLADFVREGLITYRDLYIVDQSRKRGFPRVTYQVDMETYGNKITVRPYPHLILATEKDTMFRELNRIASLYGCSCISGHGQNSFAATEDMINTIRDDLKEKSELIILTFTDYDGAGYEIADTFKDQAEYCLRNAGLFHVVVRTERLGLNLDQMSGEEIENNKYRLTKNTVNRKWFRKTGGVSGEFYGVELNAIKHDRRIRIITEGIRPYIDETYYREIIRESYIRETVLAAMKERIDSIIESILESEYDNIEVEDFNVSELAIAGESSIPIGELCNNDRDEAIKSKVLSFFPGEA
jgi:hypothetical protein